MLLRMADHDGWGIPFADFCCRRTVKGTALVTAPVTLEMTFPAIMGTMLVAVEEAVLVEAIEAMTGIPAVIRLAGMVNVSPELNAWPADDTIVTVVPETEVPRADSG